MMIATALILTWLTVFAFLPRWMSRLWLVPHKNRGSTEERDKLIALGGREIYFIRDGHRLRGWYLDRGSQTKQLLLYSMGNDGDIEKRADILSLLAALNTSIFIYEYSGFGGSEGEPSLIGCLDDGLSAFDFVVENLAARSAQVVLYGESLGGAVSAYILNHRQAGGLILKSSFTSLSRVARDLYRTLWLFPDCLFPDFGAAQWLPQVRCPVMIVHGHRDRKVKWTHARCLRNVCRERPTMLWLASARHAFLTEADRNRLRRGVELFQSVVSASDQIGSSELQLEVISELQHSEQGLEPLRSSVQDALSNLEQANARLKGFAVRVTSPRYRWRWHPAAQQQSTT